MHVVGTTAHAHSPSVICGIPAQPLRANTPKALVASEVITHNFGEQNRWTA
jgi:hypothetical protein